MTTTIALRRVATASSASRPLALISTRKLHMRSYTTSAKEVADPQLNGYPQLPFVSRQHQPALGWQDPLMRRNFGDTLHEQDEVLSMWGPDIPPVPTSTATIQFLIAVTGFVGVGFLLKSLAPEPPAIRREYPFSGLVQELGGLEENKARPESTEEA